MKYFELFVIAINFLLMLAVVLKKLKIRSCAVGSVTYLIGMREWEWEWYINMCLSLSIRKWFSVKKEN